MIGSELNLNHQTIYDISTLGCCITTTLPINTANSVKEVLTKNGIPAVSKPSHSLDLRPCDFLLFPKLKFHLKSRHFKIVDNIQKVLTDQPRAPPHEYFQHCCREWEQLFRQYVPSLGNYFEVDDGEF
jgi:hypothetical protein